MTWPKYKRKTTKRMQPELDENGFITGASLRQGNFRKLLRQYMTYVSDCIEHLQPHLPIDEWYKANVEYEFKKSRAMILYINNKKS